MHNRDNFDLPGGNLINYSVRFLVNLPKGPLGILVNRMSLCRVFGHFSYTFNYACDHAGGLKLRISRDESLYGTKLSARLGRPGDFHATPNSLRIKS
jgi:hypothetical protein